MQGVTLLIALSGSMMALFFKPAYAYSVFITALLWYPSYLRVSIGTIDISVGRVVVTVLLLRCISDKRILRKFTWSRLDTWVLLSMILAVGVVLVTLPFRVAFENRAGFLMDTWFAYLATRFLLTDRNSLMSFIKCIGIILIPLAILGVIESSTGWQPFYHLKRFTPWKVTSDGPISYSTQARFGLNRAIGPFNHAILYGCSLAMFLPFIFSLRHERKWRITAYVVSGVLLAGTLSSMSSGPWVMLIITVLCLVMERYKAVIKPVLIIAVLLCVVVGVASNRPIYHVVVSYLNPIGGSGWHRARLIDAAIATFNEWWLIGYKGKDPGWGSYTGMAHTDVTNHILLAGVKYGVAGIIVLLGTLVSAWQILYLVYNNTVHPQVKSFSWAMGCCLIGVMVAWMSVSFFGQIETLFYCVIGLIGSLEFYPENKFSLTVTR